MRKKDTLRIFRAEGDRNSLVWQPWFWGSTRFGSPPDDVFFSSSMRTVGDDLYKSSLAFHHHLHVHRSVTLRRLDVFFAASAVWRCWLCLSQLLHVAALVYCVRGLVMVQIVLFFFFFLLLLSVALLFPLSCCKVLSQDLDLLDHHHLLSFVAS